MANFVKSALDFLNVKNNECVLIDEFVGQIVQVDFMKLHVIRKISEGGFAFVYEVQDIITKKKYALKRLLGSDKEACNRIIQEIKYHKLLSGHPNIVEYVSASYVNRTYEGSTKMGEYYLVLELCSSGSISNLLTFDIEPKNVMSIFNSMCAAVFHMHEQGSPIIHRDIKIDNFLISFEGVIKLCDFGSSSTDIFSPDSSWSALDRSVLEDKLASCTTPMYRAPELLDLWSNQPIGPKTDIWALGCVLYYLCFKKHPFEDSSKLRIVNGNYTIPDNERFKCFHDIFRGCLNVNTAHRFTIIELRDKLLSICVYMKWSLEEPIHMFNKTIISKILSNHNKRDCKENTMSVESVSTLKTTEIINDIRISSVSNNLFTSLKGGAGLFLKNLRETSSKLLHTVHNSMSKHDLDICSVTSRIVLIKYPTEVQELCNNTKYMDNVKLWLENHYSLSLVSIYNIGKSAVAPFYENVRTTKYFFCESVISFIEMYSFVEDMYRSLEENSSRVICIQCTSYNWHTASTVICSLFIYARLVAEPEDAMQILTVRRAPPELQPSDVRYLSYMQKIVTSSFNMPQSKSITLKSIIFNPVPRMTNSQDGCRLFITISCAGRIVYSTNMGSDQLRFYHFEDDTITIDLENLIVYGDFSVAVYHLRKQLYDTDCNNERNELCQFRMHTAFISERNSVIQVNKNELDNVPDGNQIDENFSVKIPISIGLVKFQEKSEESFRRNPDSTCLFGSLSEYKEYLDYFASSVKRNNHMNDNLLQDGIEFNINFLEENKNAYNNDNLVSLSPNQVSDYKLLNNLTSLPKHASTESISTNLLGDGIEFNINLLEENKNAYNNDNLVSLSPNQVSDCKLLNNLTFFPKHASTESISPNLLGDGIEFNVNLLEENTNANINDHLIPLKPNEMSDSSLLNNLTSDSGSNKFDHLNIYFVDPKVTNASEISSNSTNKIIPNSKNISLVNCMSNSITESKDVMFSNITLTESDYVSDNKSAPSDVPEDIFGEILGQQGYTFARKQSKTTVPSINAMRKEETDKSTDPDKIKILEWTDGKKQNIRALLCSMHSILWGDAKWQKCEIHMLVTHLDVKKAYRKACLAVHPDKHVGSTNENLSRSIFMELNMAWTNYENELLKCS